MTELDERKAAVLRAIVEQYVETAQPVGSQTVTHRTGLGVSAATVRNEMSVLEREGYIAQPHTSAGRVPTDRGYRYYVDHLAGAGQLAATERRRIAEFFTPATMAMDELLGADEPAARPGHRARRGSGRPRAAGGRRARPRISCCCSRASLLAVVVLSNGIGRKGGRLVRPDVDEDDVADASARLAQRLDGRRLAESRRSSTTGATREPANRSHRRRRVGSGAGSPRITTTPNRSTSAARAGSRPNTTRSSPRAPRVCSNCSNSTR